MFRTETAIGNYKWPETRSDSTNETEADIRAHIEWTKEWQALNYTFRDAHGIR